jgi:hypothetical protein
VPRSLSYIGLALTAVAIVTAAVGGTSHAEVDRNTYRGSHPGIEIIFPVDWIVAEQASFPGLLATATDPKPQAGGRMTLSLEHLREGETVHQCAERNRALLARLHFVTQPLSQDVSGAVIVQAVNPSGKKVVRQAYRRFEGDADLIFVLTLAGPRDVMPRYTRTFDDSLRSLMRLSEPGAPGAPGARDDDGDDVAAPAPPSPSAAPK